MSSKSLFERISVIGKLTIVDSRSKNWNLGVNYEDTIEGVTDRVTTS